MYKNVVFIFLIIFFFSCKGKSQAEFFPENEFRNLENLVSKEVMFSPYSIKVPKGFNEFHKRNLDVLKNQIENDTRSYFRKELIHGFSDSLNTAFIISVIKDDNLFNRLNKDFKDYLNENNKKVTKNQYTVNNIKAVQYQIKNNINNVGITNLKIFLISRGSKNYLLDFVILDRYFNDKLYSIESSLSTLKRRK